MTRVLVTQYDRGGLSILTIGRRESLTSARRSREDFHRELKGRIVREKVLIDPAYPSPRWREAWELTGDGIGVNLALARDLVKAEWRIALRDQCEALQRLLRHRYCKANSQWSGLLSCLGTFNEPVAIWEGLDCLNDLDDLAEWQPRLLSPLIEECLSLMCSD